MDTLAVFRSRSEALKIYNLMKKNRLACSTVSTPARLGVGCGISVVFGRAEEILPDIEGIFDIIFIDAAKGQYHKFFDLCEKNMTSGTLIISDNVLYKGMPCDDSFIDERRNKTISRRMKEYLEFLSTDPRFETSLLAIGDGAALSYYKQDVI